MEAISVVVRIQSPRHFSWPLIITPDLWGWILWIFLIKFKFKEGISLFLCEILEFDMTTDSWIINRELWIKLGGQKEIRKTQGINYVQHLTRIIPKNSSPFLAESALPHKQPSTYANGLWKLSPWLWEFRAQGTFPGQWLLLPIYGDGYFEYF